MSESQEQQFNPEEAQQNSSEQQATPEFQAKVAQGQFLAEQIQGMREKAQTKEDYKELQEKLVELRKIFETESNLDGYHELSDIIHSVYSNMKNPEPLSDWTWTIYQPLIERGDPTKLEINMGKLEDGINLDELLLEEDYLESNAPRTLMHMYFNGSNSGVTALEGMLKGSKVKGFYNKEKMTWRMELEPQGYEDMGFAISKVVNELAVNKPMHERPWKVFNIEGSDIDFIDMEVKFTSLDKPEEMKFNNFPPSELRANKLDGKMNVIGGSDSLLKLDTLFGDRKVRSFNVDGKWYLELESEVVSAELPLSNAIQDIVQYLNASGMDIDREAKEWKLSMDQKYIDMNVRLPGYVKRPPGFFAVASNEDFTKICDLDDIDGFDMTDFGYSSLISRFGPNLKVKSILAGERWFLKIII